MTMFFSNTFMQEQACWVVHKLLMKCWQILGFYGLESSANQRALLTVYSIFPLNLTIFISLFPSCILLFTYLLSLSLIYLKPTNYFVWNIFRATILLSLWVFSHRDKAWDDLFHISVCLQSAFILMRLHISCIFSQCFWTSLIVISLRPCKLSLRAAVLSDCLLAHTCSCHTPSNKALLRTHLYQYVFLVLATKIVKILGGVVVSWYY